LEDVKVKLFSFNETRRFASWLKKLKGKKIRIVNVTMSQPEYTVYIVYEVEEEESV